MRRNLHAGKSQSGGCSINILTNDELYEIHLATLEVLEKVGILVGEEEALDILDGGGAVIDRKTKIVKFPPYMVEDAIRSAPSKICLAGRNPRNDIVLETNRVGFTNFGAGINIIDPETGQIRGTTKADVADSALLVDHLNNLDIYMKAVDSLDAPQESLQLHNAEAVFPNTTKHFHLGGISTFILTKLVEMAAVIAGGKDVLRERPLISFVTCPVSPLQLIGECCEVIMGAARAGMPVSVLSMAMAGGSSSVPLAGTLVGHNAEVLGGLILSQLTRKGTPFLYGSSTTAMDLKSATASVGSPECALINTAVAQMARYYLLPSWVAGG